MLNASSGKLSVFMMKSGLFFAADRTAASWTMWGAAYLLYIGFPLEEQVKKAWKTGLQTHRDRYLYHGQVCHLPDGEPWEKLLIYVAPGEYQKRGLLGHGKRVDLVCTERIGP